MAALSAVTVVNLTTFHVDVSGGNYQTDPTSTTNWAVEMIDDAATYVSVYKLTKQSATRVTVEVHPEMSPGQKYRIKTTVKDDGGSNLTTNSLEFTVTATLVAAVETFPLGLLEAIFLAFGDTMEYYQGRPTTQLVAQVDSGATDAIFVETTLGFPWKGAVWVGDSRVTYEHKTDGAFLALTWDELNKPGYGQKTKVYLDTKYLQASDTPTDHMGLPDSDYWQNLIDY
jgi:hypothetical protein